MRSYEALLNPFEATIGDLLVRYRGASLWQRHLLEPRRSAPVRVRYEEIPPLLSGLSRTDAPLPKMIPDAGREVLSLEIPSGDG